MALLERVPLSPASNWALLRGSGSPGAGAGTNAPIGSWYVDADSGATYSKVGAASTNWAQFASTSGFLPLSGGEMDSGATIRWPGSGSLGAPTGTYPSPGARLVLWPTYEIGMTSGTLWFGTGDVFDWYRGTALQMRLNSAGLAWGGGGAIASSNSVSLVGHSHARGDLPSQVAYEDEANSYSAVQIFQNTAGEVVNTAPLADKVLTVRQATVNADAFMAFHVQGDYAAFFGLGGAENDLVWGGWSAGNVRHRILHSGNFAALNTWAMPYGGGSFTGAVALNDQILYLRSLGDGNHFLRWNTADGGGPDRARLRSYDRVDIECANQGGVVAQFGSVVGLYKKVNFLGLGASHFAPAANGGDPSNGDKLVLYPLNSDGTSRDAYRIGLGDAADIWFQAVNNAGTGRFRFYAGGAANTLGTLALEMTSGLADFNVPVDAATEYRINGVQRLAHYNDGNLYTILRAPDNVVTLYMGSTNPATYHRNTTHYFDNRDGSVAFAYVNSVGVTSLAEFRGPSGTGWLGVRIWNSNLWSGAATYATIGSIDANQGIMLQRPHVPWLAGYGAIVRMGSNATATNYWDMGVYTTDTYGVLRDGAALFYIRNNGQVGVQNNLNAAAYTGAALEVRERGFGGVQDNTWATAPRIGFHWSGVVASQIGMASSGHLYVLNNPGTGYMNLYAANFGVVSDARLKSDLRRIEGALDRIDRLAGYTFYKQGSDRRQAGVTSQDVRRALPEAVDPGAFNGYDGVHDAALTGLLVEGIKELRAELRALAARVN